MFNHLPEADWNHVDGWLEKNVFGTGLTLKCLAMNASSIKLHRNNILSLCKPKEANNWWLSGTPLGHHSELLVHYQCSSVTCCEWQSGKANKGLPEWGQQCWAMGQLGMTISKSCAFSWHSITVSQQRPNETWQRGVFSSTYRVI